MPRRKTTIYLDDDLLAATKVVAASTDRSESDVVSDALRSYLRSAGAQAAAEELKALVARVIERGEADEDEALTLAVAETRAVRRRARR
jgi:metal-responsive CopG/Arc/MetJ family transcriptional regulator